MGQRRIFARCSIGFFFFQAEDGIRDYKVTGVQTCALPISRLCTGAAAHAEVSGLRGTAMAIMAEVVASRRAIASLGVGMAPDSNRHACLNGRSEEHTSELQSPCNLVCRLLLEKKKNMDIYTYQ